MKLYELTITWHVADSTEDSELESLIEKVGAIADTLSQVAEDNLPEGVTVQTKD